MLPLRRTFDEATGGLPRVFWTLWWGMLVNRLAGFVITFLALYLVRERGFSEAAAGRVVALYGLGIVVAGPVGGAVADRVGRRVTMLAGLVLGALFVAALALAHAPGWLALLTFLAGATGELYRPAMNAAVADVVPPPDRARAFGLVYWAVNLGWALGLFVAGLLAGWGLQVLFFADAATTLGFAALVALRLPETRPAGLVHEPALAGLARVLRDGPYLAFLLLNLAMLIIFTQFQLAAAVDLSAHGVSERAWAFLLAINGVGVVVLQPLLTPRLAGQDGVKLLAVSALLVGLGFALNAIQGHLAVYALGMALWTVGEVVGFPAASTLVADLAPAHLRGRYQGAFSMSWGVAFTLSPIIGGEVLGRFGGPTLWLGCLIVGVLVALGHLLAGPARRRRLAEVRAQASAPAARTG
ncbi:MAG: MFS transporter [Anaeromyxobacter sp.]